MFSKKKLLYITLISFMLKKSEMAGHNASNINFESPEVENTFRLIDEGDKIIQLSNQHRNITLVLGNTGAGKSTLLQWITGNTNLTSKETLDGLGEFIIEDGNRIGSTIMSKTMFPELVIDNRTNAAFYDCPGFSDTRSSSHDIAATYFIKKIADHSTNVKILLVVNYPSVSRGVDRQDFMLLMRHATTLIKNIEKYQDSVAIVVTKVNNNYVKEKKTQNLILVPDKNITQAIGEYMKTVHKTLNDKLKNELVANEEKVFFENGIKLLNILLKTNEDKFRRIAIFRRPDESGPLSEIEIIQEGQHSVEIILYQELKFYPKSFDDFRYTISDRSKKEVYFLIDKINDKVWDQVSAIVKNVQDHYKLLYQGISNKIHSFLGNVSVKPDLTTANEFVRKIKAGEQEISWLILESKNVTNIDWLAEAIKWRTERLGIKTCKVNIDRITAQGRLYAFFQVLSGKELQTRPWWSLFEKIESSFAILKKNLEKDVLELGSKVMDSAEVDISEIVQKLKHHYAFLFEEMNERIHSFIDYTRTVEADEAEARSFEKSIKDGISVLNGLVIEIMNVEKLSRVANATKRNLSPLRITELSANTDHILVYGEYLEFLQILTCKKLIFKPWWSSFQAIESYLVELKKNFNEDTNKISLILYEINAKHVENIGKAIEDYYQKKIDSTEIEKMPDELLEGFVIVTEWINDTCNREKVSRNSKELFANLNEQIKNSKLATVAVSISQDALKFKSYGKYVIFLQVFNNLEISLCKWLVPLRDSAQLLKDLEIFMQFLHDLYDKFSQYDVQKDKQKYNVANLKEWGKRGESQGVHIDKNNFRLFLEKIGDANLVGYSTMKELDVTDFHLRLLNLALVKTLAFGFNMICSKPDKLVISGDFIKFSDFVRPDGIINNNCEYEIKHVNIFAFVVLFMDRDIQANGFQFSIIAPKWEVIGNKKISLDGVGGAYLPKAKGGMMKGASGDNGIAGLPGEPGGNFLGIGQKFVHLQNLSITANGGPGGPGQEGGDGQEGAKGPSAARSDDFKKRMLRDDKLITVFFNEVIEQWVYYGKAGERGGTGGNGGKGGLGGWSGKIRFLPLEKTFDLPSTKMEQGHDGQGGKGGKGGEGGEWGDDLFAKFCDRWALFIPYHRSWCWEKHDRNTARVSSGENGADGSDAERQHPKQGKDFQSIHDAVMDYKAYVQDNSGDIFKATTLNEFLYKIDGIKN